MRLIPSKYFMTHLIPDLSFRVQIVAEIIAVFREEIQAFILSLHDDTLLIIFFMILLLHPDSNSGSLLHKAILSDMLTHCNLEP